MHSSGSLLANLLAWAGFSPLYPGRWIGKVSLPIESSDGLGWELDHHSGPSSHAQPNRSIVNSIPHIWQAFVGGGAGHGYNVFVYFNAKVDRRYVCYRIVNRAAMVCATCA